MITNCSRCGEALAPRDASQMTRERQFCGQWRSCPRCFPGGTTVLTMSDELQQQLAHLRRTGAQVDLQIQEESQ